MRFHGYNDIDYFQYIEWTADRIRCTNVIKRNGSMKFARRWRRHRVARSRNSSQTHVYIYFLCRYVICIAYTYAFATRILERTPPVRTTVCWRARVCEREIFNISQWWIFIRPYNRLLYKCDHIAMYMQTFCYINEEFFLNIVVKILKTIYIYILYYIIWCICIYNIHIKILY